MNKKLLDKIQEERKFLHDIANQLTIVQGLGGLLGDDLKTLMEKNIDVNNASERMGKINTSIQKMTELLKSRRAQIIIEQELISDEEE